VGFLSPVSGAFVQKAYINNTAGLYDPVLGGPSAFSPDSHTFLMALGVLPSSIDFLAANLLTGNTNLYDFCGYTTAMAYDPVTQSFLGIGLEIDPSQPSGYMRTLVALASDGSSCKVLGNIPGYFLMDSVGVTIDVAARFLYWVAMPCTSLADPGCQGDLDVPFDLVKINLNTLGITAAKSFCFINGASPACPWEIEALNK
jgi:hypothetical protein